MRNQHVSGASDASISITKRSLLGKSKSVSKKRSGVSTVKVASYTSVFLLFVGVVAIGYQKPESSTSQFNQTANVNAAGASTSKDDSKAPSVDEIVATDVAASLTESANLPVASNIANTSVSLHAKNDLAQNDDSVISKPQIVKPTSAGRTVTNYTVKKGDSVKSVAAQFGISEKTVKWANDLESDKLIKDTKLTILPTDGVLHKVEKGESVKELAKKYNTSESRIISYNDLEMSKKPAAGTKIIIPSGVLPSSERPGYENNSQSSTTSPQQPASNGFGENGGVVNTDIARASAGNRYAAGNCTWYAYERREELGKPVGSFWGNANTWGINARSAGYKVNGTPSDGAVLVDTAGFYGHVAVVEHVKANGDIEISEMNNLAYGGFNIVNSRTISAGQAASYQYIH